MSLENQWLEDVFPTEIVPFRRHVSFRGCKSIDNLVGTHLGNTVICRLCLGAAEKPYSSRIWNNCDVNNAKR